MARPQEVAETIQHQLRSGADSRGVSGSHMMMCWAYQKPKVIGGDEDYWGGLEFKVDANKFAGTVKVMLSYNDTYTVYYISRVGLMVHYEERVHAPELAETIDSFVETTRSGVEVEA